MSSGASRSISMPSRSPRAMPRSSSAEARRLRLIEVVETLRRSVAIEMDLRLEAAALSEMAENTKDDPDFRVPAVDWDRTARDVLTLEWIDGTPLHDRARLEAKGFDLQEPRARGDPDVPAARAARRLLPRRHASRQSVRRRRGPPGRGRLRHHGTARAEGAAVPRRNPLRLHHPQLSTAPRRCISRPATCRAHHSVADFAQAIRAIGEPIHNRTAEDISMAKLLMLLFEVTGAVRHAHAAGAAAAAEDHGGGRGRRARARSQARHVDGGRAGGARMDRASSRPGGTGRRRGRGRGRCRPLPRRRPVAAVARAGTLVEQLDAITRDGLVLAPETVAAIGRAEARRNRWTAVALWVIAGILALMLWTMI